MNLRKKTFKIIGLIVALVLPLALPYLCNNIFHIPAGSLIKELMAWLPFVLLFFIVKYGEETPFADLGFRYEVGKSIMLGGLILISIVGVMAVYSWLYFLILKQHPPKEDITAQIMRIPLWTRILIAIRAGVTEETLFRAYGISRLMELTRNRYLSIGLPLVLFAAGHYSYGNFPHIANAFVIGSVLTFFFVRRRNLVANIFAHTALDTILFLM